MLSWLKSLVKRYDKWCEELGLTPENKRSCVPHRTDPVNTDSLSDEINADQSSKPSHE